MYRLISLATASLLLFDASSVMAQLSADDLIDLPLEELMQMEATVSSVSKRDESLRDIPAAIFVVTREDIRRSAVTNVPDTLRMVPGIQVGKISSSEWAVSARGLGGRFSRYLLVLIDGRSIYTSLFSGVNWDEINLSLENIERIEVIRGPGGTIWGANAVNGMVNIITRTPDAVSGTTARLSAGSGETTGSAYVGTKLAGEYGHLTMSGHLERNEAMDQGTSPFTDNPWQNGRFDIGWQHQQGSSEWQLNVGYSNIQSNVAWSKQQVHGLAETATYGDDQKTGYFAVGKWQRPTNTGLWSARLSVDSMDRDGDAYQWNTKNGDAEIQWAGELASNHQTTFGVALRISESDFQTPTTGMDATLIPEFQRTTIRSFYAQDTWQLLPSWNINAGVRYDDNSDSSDAWQPSVRSLWRVADHHSVWAGSSRAVSTPSRVLNNESYLSIDTIAPDITNPLPALIILESTGAGVEDVELTAYEIGYRYIPSQALSIDLTAFQHNYDNILAGGSLAIPELRFENNLPYLALPVQLNTSASQTSEGIEISARYQINEQWLVQYGGSYFQTEVHQGPSVLETLLEDVVAVPKHQHNMRVFWNASSAFEVDVGLRFASEPDSKRADAYTAMDVNVNYRLTPKASISLSARNLFIDETVEYTREIFSVGSYVVKPSVLLKLQWQID